MRSMTELFEKNLKKANKEATFVGFLTCGKKREMPAGYSIVIGYVNVHWRIIERKHKAIQFNQFASQKPRNNQRYRHTVD